MSRSLGNHPLVILLGIVASLITVFAFLSGVADLPSALRRDRHSDAIDDDGKRPIPAAMGADAVISPDSDPTRWIDTSFPDNEDFLPLDSFTGPVERGGPVNSRSLGRLTGYHTMLARKGGCDTGSGLQYAYYSFAVYSSSEGALQAQEWRNSLHEEKYSSTPEPLHSLGHVASILIAPEANTDGCTPENMLDEVFINMVVGNVAAMVNFSYVSGSSTSATMRRQTVDSAYRVTSAIWASSD